MATRFWGIIKFRPIRNFEKYVRCIFANAHTSRAEIFGVRKYKDGRFDLILLNSQPNVS